VGFCPLVSFNDEGDTDVHDSPALGSVEAAAAISGTKLDAMQSATRNG
jgi:hypothetical protein